MTTAAIDAARFIEQNFRIAPTGIVPEIRLYQAHPGSGLWRLARGRRDAPPPYWAYPWAGGSALARYILDNPATVAGRRVMDIGAGSGLVAIAAAKSGVARIIAADIDPHALAATRLNAGLNGVSLETLEADPLDGPVPEVDLLLAGDLFYAAPLATRALAFFERCIAAGIDVLVGDPYRAHLPSARLRLLEEYVVRDFADGAKEAETRSGVFAVM